MKTENWSYALLKHILPYPIGDQEEDVHLVSEVSVIKQSQIN